MAQYFMLCKKRVRVPMCQTRSISLDNSAKGCGRQQHSSEDKTGRRCVRGDGSDSAIL
jgi:hypothetical protein